MACTHAAAAGHFPHLSRSFAKAAAPSRGKTELLHGIHPVSAALKYGFRTPHSVTISARSASSPRMKLLMAEARAAGAAVTLSKTFREWERTLPNGAAHQGVVAEVPERRARRLPRAACLASLPSGGWHVLKRPAGDEAPAEAEAWQPWGEQHTQQNASHPFLLVLEAVRGASPGLPHHGETQRRPPHARRCKTCRTWEPCCALLHSW